MSQTPSTMIALGTQAPDFTLPSTDGEQVSLADFEAKQALVVVFMCPHCPFVKHVQDELATIANEYQSKGVGFVGISANDIEQHPDDDPEHMKQQKESVGFPFPYLYDESQEVAKAYKAACTPDIFVFDGQKKLVYRGQLDDSRPSTDVPVTGADVRGALDAVLAGEPITQDQKPSSGCNIKWKPGNEPDYFG